MNVCRRILLGMLGLALCLPMLAGSRALADGNSSIAIANRYVNQHTVGGVRVDLDRVDILKLMRRVKEMEILSEEESAQAMQAVGLADAAIKGLVSSGADDIFVLFDARRMEQGVTVVLTISPEKANDETAELIKTTIEYLVPQQARNGMVFEARTDHVIFGFADGIQPVVNSSHTIPAFVAADRMQTATLFMSPSADHLRAARETLPNLPPPFDQFNAKQFARDLSYATVDLQLDPTIEIGAIVNATSEAGAAQMEQSLNDLLGVLIKESKVEDELPQLAEKLVTHRWEAQGTRCEFRMTEESIGLETLLEVLPFQLAQARGAAARSTMMNNQKQILLALHNYYDSHGKFPANIKDENGNDILSWRVELLPYLEQQALYQAIKKDQPWNGPDNSKFSELVVPVFACPLFPELQPGKTLSTFVVAEGTLGGPEAPTKFQHITDGTSNTIAMVMAAPDRAVNWMAPDDLEIDLENPKEGLFWVNDEYTLVGFLDGSVRALAKTLDDEMLKRLYQCADGMVIDID